MKELKSEAWNMEWKEGYWTSEVEQLRDVNGWSSLYALLGKIAVELLKQVHSETGEKRNYWSKFIQKVSENVFNKVTSLQKILNALLSITQIGIRMELRRFEIVCAASLHVREQYAMYGLIMRHRRYRDYEARKQESYFFASVEVKDLICLRHLRWY